MQNFRNFQYIFFANPNIECAVDECIDEQYKRQRIASLKKSIVFKINQAMQSGRVTKIRKIALGVVEAAVWKNLFKDEIFKFSERRRNARVNGIKIKDIYETITFRYGSLPNLMSDNWSTKHYISPMGDQIRCTVLEIKFYWNTRTHDLYFGLSWVSERFVNGNWLCCM